MGETKRRVNVGGLPSRIRELLWDGALPQAYGLGIVAVLILSIASIVVFADAQSIRHRRTDQQARAGEIAALLAAALAKSDEPADPRPLDLSSLTFVRSVRCFDPDGLLTIQWPPLSAIARGADAATTPDGPAAAPTGPTTTATAAIPGGGRVEVVCAFVPSGADRSTLFLGAAGVAAVAVAAFAVVDRRVRRRMRPIAAVQQSLCALASGVETQISALSLSDTLGQVGRAWNQLVSRIQELQEQAQRPAPAERSGAMVRFESRALRQILDRLPLGILRFGAAETISYANPSAARLLGRAPQELVGAALGDVLSDEDTLTHIRARVASGSAAAVDRKRGDGETQQVLRFVALPRGDGPADMETVVTIDDVSHFQEAERARDHFLYHVTHELRTPLTNIQAYAETLTKPDFDDEQMRRECYNVISSETRRLSALIEDILNISQLEVGSARLEVGEVDLVRLLRQMVQDNLGAADEKNVELTLRLPPKAPRLRGDKQRLSVLINNLIGNAIKYTPSGGQATVTLNVHDDRLEVVVADTGIGIDPADQPRVFDKFYRAQSEDVQQIKGTGLGLAIAREVARLHGGDIRLTSEKGKGSTFTLELPQTRTEALGVSVP